ncbi:MAG: bifunctional aspartate kinase/homoserine dehydrogenase I [Deltaproteobacteria bacterium]|nr:bifunctional aspartate kinase/homoserine dehydrogenase I [Deltaproteobacteria bacterium]
MRILKFGGSSVASPERIREVASIACHERKKSPLVVVVSALGGVTDQLLEAGSIASGGSSEYLPLLEALTDRHLEAANQLTLEDEQKALTEGLRESFREIESLLQGIALLREASPRTLDSLSSYGERLSSRLVAAAFRAHGLTAAACDARELIVTEAAFSGARVDWETTRARIRKRFSAAASQPTAVVTGFIAATPAGETTTLGRGGSDYTASLLGAALDAQAVELWTDVDGVMSADPRLVGGAEPIAHLSYVELMELSHFGAKVVYPPSVHPTRKAGIPLLIRNTLNPEAPGTRVASQPAEGTESSSAKDFSESSNALRPVRGIASIPKIALMRLEGDGMVGVPGIAMRLFATLARRGVNVILITQASSEHSICFGVAPESIPQATAGVAEEFALERQAGLIEDLILEEDLAVVAVVGRRMRDTPGLAGRLFTVLGEQGISVRAIAQGSSELNISLVVSSRDERPAVRALHAACFPTASKVVELYLVGTGRVGAALLQQLAAHGRDVQQRRGVRLVLAGVARRNVCLASPEGIDPGSAIQRLAAREGSEGDGLRALLTSLSDSRASQRIFIDATAGSAATAAYAELLRQGVSVVAANKLLFAGPLKDYRSITQTGPGRIFFETTVGAGLPVVRTVSDLVATGDRIRSVEGLLSGTLSFVLDRLQEGLLFSQALRQAYDLGYTEPDPREDLSGQDVARKLLILSRLAHWDLEPEDVKVEPLIPTADLESGDLEEFWRRLPIHDEAFESKRQAAAESGQRLCYLGILDDKGARIGLSTVEGSHPAAGLRGSDNLVALFTERYSSTPLVVRGPGAGPEVTAAGVFADLLRAVDEGPKIKPFPPAFQRPSAKDRLSDTAP